MNYWVKKNRNLGMKNGKQEKFFNYFYVRKCFLENEYVVYFDFGVDFTKDRFERNIGFWFLKLMNVILGMGLMSQRLGDCRGR